LPEGVTLYICFIFGLSLQIIARTAATAFLSLKQLKAIIVPYEATVDELDEMWHYLPSKKTSSGSGRLIVAIPAGSLIENLILPLLKRLSSFSPQSARISRLAQGQSLLLKCG
jgi:hypothetical protein